MENWKVSIRPEISRLGSTIVIYRELVSGSVEVYDPTSAICTVVPRGAAFTATMYITDEMLKALFDELQGKGMKPKEQSFVEGKLLAQTEHLRDLQDLLDL